jgi:hypothetical protein
VAAEAGGCFERVWVATGSEVDVCRDPLLGPLHAACPICTHQGLPCLTPCLAWTDKCDLFVLGYGAGCRREEVHLCLLDLSLRGAGCWGKQAFAALVGSPCVLVDRAYSALTVGPDAFNLMGARMGSCRVAHVLAAIIQHRGQAGKCTSPGYSGRAW